MFENIKDLRGLFYRKVKKATEEKELVLPGFSIRHPKLMIEFPEIDDVTKTNITYSLIEPFAYVNIKWDEREREIVYIVVEPQLNETEREHLYKISDAIVELVDVELTAIKDGQKVVNYLETQVAKVLREFGLVLTPDEYVKIMYYIYRNFIGYNEIEPFLQDPNIEDISCDGINTPIYIVHRKFGSLKTNIVFEKIEELREFVIKLAERCGRYVSYAEPILDGTLPDGSRVSATLAGDVATRGPVFTIRKFGDKPFSPIEHIELGTANAEILAYFWYLIEHKSSILIVGGTSTGKTSLLNSICMFIQPEAKIVSIEDTREIRIPHEHWTPGLARVGFGIPMPTGEKYGEVTMFDLLKESFRQNPDYVIVGETRGPETYVMFQGMSSGHSSMSTFHAGSVDTVIKRLTTPPIELSSSLIESLDVIVVMTHAKERSKSARRIKEIVEVESVDPHTEEIKTSTIFKWDPATDTYEKMNESIKVKKIVATIGGDENTAFEEVERRKRILEWLKQKNVKDYLEVIKYINEYYKEPKKLLGSMGESVTVPLKLPLKVKMPLKVESSLEKPKKRASVFELLGFKFFKEK